jgi:hypothetical protein
VTRLSSEPQQNEVQAEGFRKKSTVKEVKTNFIYEKQELYRMGNTVKKKIGAEIVKYFN